MLRAVGKSLKLFTQSLSLLHQSERELLLKGTLTRQLTVKSEVSSEAREGDDAPQKEISELRKQVEEFKDKYTRALAENENARRRSKKLLDDTKVYAIQSFAKDLLEIADILEKAKDSITDEMKQSNELLRDLHDGVVMTETQLHSVFQRHGLVKLQPVDEKFDPHFHEALFHQPVPGKISGTIASVQKTGYRLHERPLRPALVSVVK